MTETIEPRPLKRTIPPDLQREVEDIQKKVPRTTGSPYLDDSKKRWLVVGICLHTVVSPVLRAYIEPVVTKLCYSLTRLYKINKQTYGSYLKKYSPTNTVLNYEAINSNKAIYAWKRPQYDYRVKSPVDLSRLFLQTHMAHFTAFDDSCDSSALLGIIVNIDRFPSVVQSDAQKIRSDIRNPWAHCDFTEWTTTKYADSFQLMGQLIRNLRMSSREENRIIGEINRWEINGQNFLSGTKLGLEIVGEICHQTNILSEYVQTLCTETDNQFTKVKRELTGIESGLQEIIERIKDLESKCMEHDVKLKNLDMQKQDEDPIPKNIREQIQNVIENWEKKDTMFVSTRASDYVIECLQENSCVTLTGPSGAGKSFISRHTALVLQKEGYKIVPVYAPTDIRDYYQPGKQTVFIVDDMCGNFTANQQQIENWKQMLPVINTIIADKCKIIVSCRLQVYKDDKFKILSPFKSCECNLISDELCLTSNEKTKLAKTYNIGASVKDINDLSQNSDYFPLLCSRYNGGKNSDVREFFRNPFGVYKAELDSLGMHGDEGNYKICSLALCVILNNQLTEKWFQDKVTDEQRHIIEDTCDACEINRSTSKAKLKKALDTLDGTFISKQNGIYRAIHDKLFDFLAHYFGQKMIECLIDHGDSYLVHERFLWQKSPDDKNSNIDFIIEMPDDYLESYLERFIKDWSAGKVSVVFSNTNMKVSSFRGQLLQYLLQLEKSKQVTLANNTDTVLQKEECGLGSSPLIYTCYDGYTDMVQWMLHNNVNVDHCRDDGVNGLYMASQEGYTGIVKLLLEKFPNVDLCTNNRCSPLYMACDKGHTDIVQLLLGNHPNVDLCTKDDWSPLCIASQQGHTDIVRLLLEKNANVHLCSNDGWSPLYIASWEGYIDIVRLLLEKNHIVDLCDNSGTSPLYMASQQGNTDVVRLLLEKNANVNLYDIDGVSPLYWASQEGHTEIVGLLLEKNANVNQCDIDGVSPLYTSSQNGHTDIVRLLLDKNPLVDQCPNDGVSLLFMGSQEEHTDEVRLLLEKDHVDLCKYNGPSPLIKASQNGHIDVVRLLLEKNANVNLCDYVGCSALIEASQNGHTDVVKLLLEMKADCNVCVHNKQSMIHTLTNHSKETLGKYKKYIYDRLVWNTSPNVKDYVSKQSVDYAFDAIAGSSPLHFACFMGRIDLVRVLLDHNVNINMKKEDDITPLFYACEVGHDDIVRLLLDGGADSEICRLDGKSPLNIATDNGHDSIVMIVNERTKGEEKLSFLLSSCSLVSGSL